MIRWLTIGILSVALIGTGVWGYQEHQEKNQVLIQAENSYQRSFHELTYYMDLLHDEIGTVLAMNSHQKLSPKFVDIWRVTSEAHSNVSQLPLGLLPFYNTEAFLSEIGEFTYRTAVRNLDDEPLTNEETKVLEQLYTQANEIKDELRHIQHQALDNNIRWMDVQLALINNDEDANPVIDGLRTVDSSAQGYSETNSKSGLVGLANKTNYFDQLDGDSFSEEDAIEIGKDIFEIENEEDISITRSSDGAEIPVYSLTYNNNEKYGYMDITEKGGHPLSILVERPIEAKEMSLHDGAERAEEYLKKFGFEDMVLYQSTEYDSNGLYSFLYNQDGIRVFSDAVEMKIALDNGDLIGFTANRYYSNHHEREINEPEISEEEALSFVNPSVEIQEKGLAIIENDLNEEVFTYEFLGTLGNDTYRIYINAMNGNEEKVEKLDGKELRYS
ncbi:germination protein YpeB [Oceanobacillus sp. CAU 1775]